MEKSSNLGECWTIVRYGSEEGGVKAFFSENILEAKKEDCKRLFSESTLLKFQ
jgi:hypothetical protein